jgi:serine/threonine protein kinase
MGRGFANPSPIQPQGSPPPHTPIQPPTIPDHELLQRIGAGSYGDVWLGRNKLGTLRAIKIVRRAAFEDARPFEREFKGVQKFEPISRSHEGLVDILQVGGTEEYFYYVMELADSVSSNQCSVISHQSSEAARPAVIAPPLNTDPLITDYSPRTLRSDLKRHGRLPVAECVRIGLALAEALAHLHRQRLVHRDIKPSNIIFVGGVPKLADIGLVADVGEARSFVGTQGFIPPEGPGTPQADLYSLGKVLYELSTGKDRHDFPELPDNLRDLPDQDALIEFNAVMVKTCAADPRQRYRYQSAEELHADIALLQRGESVQRKHAAKRRRTVAARLSLVAAFAAVLAFGGARLRQFANQNQNQSQAVAAGGTIQPEMTGTLNREAWNAYVNGLHFYKRDTLEDCKRAVEHLKQAARLDPKFARPHAALAEAYRYRNDLFRSEREALTNAKAAALHAVALDDSLAQAHKELGWLLANLDRDFAKAELEVKRALELSPDYATGHGVYAWILLKMRRVDEAKREIQSCLRLDPVFPRARATAAHIFLAAGDRDEAVAQLRKALDLDPNHRSAFYQLGDIHEDKGEIPEAIELFRRGAIADGIEPGKAAQTSEELLRAFSTGGAPDYWRKKVELADPHSSLGAGLYGIAVAHLHLEQTELAFEALEKLEARGSRFVVDVNFDRRFDGVRSEPRFQALLQKLGLGQGSGKTHGDTAR